MGLLDDAIREHLDLKRRRGADPSEIERAEREALGPVRRGPEVTGEEPAPGETETPLESDYHEAETPLEPEYHEPEAAPPEPEAASTAPASEQWEPFQEDPELRALDEHEELTPYEPARAPDGDPLMDDERLSGEPSDTAASPRADLSAASESAAPPAPHPADPPPSPATHDEPSSHVDKETEEYELEPEDAADDDVLETTPEFLQDAPEHDRLWFEQRPPRDFDFDG
jgi:hypothetical protein